MRKKLLTVPVLITLLFVTLGLAPLRKFCAENGLAEYAVVINFLIKGSIFILGVRWLVKKFDLYRWAGFRNPIWKNQWLVALPLIFPGVFYFSNLSFKNLDNPLLDEVLICFAAGFFEEIVFRGLIQGYLIKNSIKPNYHRIFLFTSFLFAIGHYGNLVRGDFGSVSNQVFSAFFLGLVFSAIQFRVNNIWLLGMSHAVLDFIVSLGGHAPETDQPTQISILDYLAGIGSMILLMSPLLFIYWLLTRNMSPTPVLMKNKPT